MMKFSIIYHSKRLPFLYIFLLITLSAIDCFPSIPTASVTIRGISEDETITFVRLQRQTYLWNDFFTPIFDLTIHAKDQKFSSQFPIQSPTVLNFNILGRSIKIYVMPGDEIEFKIKKNPSSRPDVIFNGPNSSNYNYGEIYEKRNFILNRTLTYEPMQSLDSFRLSLDSWYNNEIKLVRNFKLKHSDFSESYYEYVLQDLGFRYAALLYSPFRKNKSFYKHVPYSYFLQVDKIFADLKISQFSVNTMNALTSKYIFGYADNIEENYHDTYKNILKNFDTRTREYLLCNFFGILSKTQNENCLNFLTLHFDEASQYVSDTNYLKYLERCKQNFSKIGQIIPDSITMNTLLVSYQGDSITMKHLLALYPNKPIYFDLWASWCSACRVDIKDSEATKTYFKKENIQNIYLSLDRKTQIADWKKASETDGIVESQFLIINEFSSEFIKYLGVKSLPRYIILSKDHKIINYDAPRPNKTEFVELKRAFDSEASSRPLP